MRWILLVCLLSGLCSRAQNTLGGVGAWREHLPYGSTVDVTASDKSIFAATPYSFFRIDLATQEIQRFSRVSGLSESGVSTIEYDRLAGKLYVAYTNSNIDILDSRGIRNVPDLKRASLSGDKTIYHIFPDNNRAYLSTGLGVAVLDAAKEEIREIWPIGNTGNAVKVNGFTRWNGAFYAATEEGLKRTPTSNPNPANFAGWQRLSGTNGLAAAPSKFVATAGNRLFTVQNDSLFVEAAGSWSLLFANDFTIISLHASGEKLILSQRKANGASQVVILNPDGSVFRTLQQPGVISYPKKGIAVGSEFWVADLFGGLSQWTGTAYQTYRPNAPDDLVLGQMTAYNGKLYATAGSVNDSWNYLYNRSGVFKLEGGEWTAYNQFRIPRLDTLLDFITVAVDPRDESLWAGSYGGGLLHIDPANNLTIYKQNSPIAPTVGDPTSYRVAGLAFDADNNLWVSNFGSDTPLHVRKADGTWRSFRVPFLLNLNATAGIVIDDANQKWIASPLNNGLLVFDHNGTLDNPNDDRWRIYRTGAGLGNLPASEVTALAKDKSGYIWVGTVDGIGVIQCPQEAFLSGCEAVLPVIKDGAFANYLFKGEKVSGIAVDGADRKWVATDNGVWLVSPDGDKVLEHFTEANSPLLSNDVRSIAIDGKTGEVFVATAKGLISYRGAATEADEEKGNVLVFPNPVAPDYDGTIAIRGLPENSFVKITEANGRLVYQTRTLGGQAVWNGRDYRGNRASSGVYVVLVADASRQEKAVAKIIFIGR